MNMHASIRRLRHLPLWWAAVLLACGIAVAAHADKGVETVRLSSDTLPPQADTESLSPSGKAFRGGVVSVANPYGAEAGAQILEKGGNAIDAAVAITYALNVVEPQSAGVGGGGFMMIYLASTRETFFIDTREKAPAGATPDMFVGVPNPTLQGVAAGVPGMVRGTALALERYGNMKLADVIQPAIKLADEGFRGDASVHGGELQQWRPVHQLAGGRSLLLPERPTRSRGVARAKQAACTDVPAHRRQWTGLLLQANPREGVRHRQGHRRGSEIQPSAGSEWQGRFHDLRGPGKLSRPSSARRS
jgi:hypothetical protein